MNSYFNNKTINGIEFRFQLKKDPTSPTGMTLKGYGWGMHEDGVPFDTFFSSKVTKTFREADGWVMKVEPNGYLVRGSSQILYSYKGTPFLVLAE